MVVILCFKHFIQVSYICALITFQTSLPLEQTFYMHLIGWVGTDSTWVLIESGQAIRDSDSRQNHEQHKADDGRFGLSGH